MAETPEKEPQAETPNKETQLDKQPAALNRRSTRMPAIVVSVSALVVIGAAAIYALSNFNIALPSFSSLAELFSRAAASAPIPDPTVTAALKDIQSSQQIQLRFSRMESFCSKTQLCCCKVRLLWNPLGRISQLSRRI